MDVVSLCPLRTASIIWRRARGEWVQTVVCKATFTLVPGVAQLAEEQEDPSEDDNHWDDDPSRSLYVPSDLVPWKPRADVLLVGKAFAPRKEPVASLVARLEVAGIDKAIEVWCDRVIAADRTVHEGQRFTSMPLVFERAAGGAETWNPVGVGAPRLPNLQPPGYRIGEANGPIPPVGFGPIAPTWPGRAPRRGGDPRWPSGGQRMPEGFDPAFFNAALSDQQVESLRGDERLVLENLHRDHERLVTRLPGIRPRALLDVPGGPREIPLGCDTLWIDTDRAICTLTWRGFVPLQVPDDAGHVIVDFAESPDARGEADARKRDVDGDRTQPILLRSHVVADVDDTSVERASSAPVLPFHSMPEPSLPVVAPAAPPSRPTLAGPMGRLVSAKAPLSVGEAAVLANKGMPTHLLVTPAVIEVDSPALETPALVPSPAPVRARGAKIGAWIPPGVAAGSAEGSSGSALGASNAAAGLAPEQGVALASSSPSVAPRAPAEALEMVWLDPDFADRIRRKSAWKELIAEAKAGARDEEAESGSREQRKESRERREALAVLRRGEPSSAAALEDQLSAALDAGAVTPPLVLVAGALAFPFDELETLKATMALVVPFASGDKKLKELCDTVGQLLASPWLEKGTAGLGGLILRLREAFAQSARGLPTGHLEAHTEQLLLERRHYQKRTVMGQVWIRASLTPAGGGEAIPAYLPESLSKELPMFQGFRARVIAELRPQVDQFEAHPLALRVAALGRIIVRSPAGHRPIPAGSRA